MIKYSSNIGSHIFILIDLQAFIEKSIMKKIFLLLRWSFQTFDAMKQSGKIVYHVHEIPLACLVKLFVNVFLYFEY